MATRRGLFGVTAAVLFGLVGGVARAAARYSTHGTVKSFGKKRRYVNIAHDDIPGYMAAMTMSFEPSDLHQLDGLVEGDRVALVFVDDGEHRIIERVAKV